MRRVVLLCGPPGAGKSTVAHASGLTVFDRDEPRWTGEQHFRSALAAIRQAPNAQAVVLRAGATSRARAFTAEVIRPTHVFVLTGHRDELRRRVRARARHDLAPTLRGIDSWLADFDRHDGVVDFPGWETIDGTALGTGVTSTDW